MNEHHKIEIVKPGSKTDYWLTLNNPEAVHGYTIPDTSFQASGTSVSVTRGSITISATGVGGLFLGTSEASVIAPFVFSQAACGFGNSAGTQFAIGGTSGSTAVSTAPFSQAATTAGVSPIQQGGGNAINLSTTAYRLVSAGLRLFTTGPALTNSGTIYAAVLPAQTHSSSNKWESETATTLKNSYQAKEFPLIIGDELRMIYAPTDPNGMIYVNTIVTTGNSSYNAAAHDPMELFVYIEGAHAADIIQFEIVHNWEEIPVNNSYPIGVRPSLVDYAALEYAFNHMAEINQVTMVQSNKLSAYGALSTAVGSIENPMRPSLVEHTDIGCYFKLPGPISRLRTTLSSDNEIFDSNYRNRVRSKSLMERIGDGLVTLAEHVAPKLLKLFGL